MIVTGFSPGEGDGCIGNQHTIIHDIKFARRTGRRHTDKQNRLFCDSATWKNNSRLPERMLCRPFCFSRLEPHNDRNVWIRPQPAETPAAACRPQAVWACCDPSHQPQLSVAISENTTCRILSQRVHRSAFEPRVAVCWQLTPMWFTHHAGEITKSLSLRRVKTHALQRPQGEPVQEKTGEGAAAARKSYLLVLPTIRGGAIRCPGVIWSSLSCGR